MFNKKCLPDCTCGKHTVPREGKPKPAGFGKRISLIWTSISSEKRETINGKISLAKKGVSNLVWSLKSPEEKEVMNKNRSLALREGWRILSQEERDSTIAKRLRACRKKPNKAELKLGLILGSDWKFVGNWEVVLSGRSPDYININGKKKLIELYGCYWHSCDICGKGKSRYEIHRRRDANAIRGYAQLGFETLIIWEHELENVATVKQKVLEFEGKEHLK